MAQMLHDWDNFYVTTDAASASLIGLLFVVVTPGADFSSSGAMVAWDLTLWIVVKGRKP